MTLLAHAKIQNVKASIERYIDLNIVINEGISVHFEEYPFEEGSNTEWIQESIIGFGDYDYHRQVDVGNKGQTTSVMLNLNAFVNRDLTTKTNRHYELRDILLTYFYIGIQIDLYDFSTSDFTNSLQKMIVREVITDQSIPNDDFFQYNLTLGIDWLQKW